MSAPKYLPLWLHKSAIAVRLGDRLRSAEWDFREGVACKNPISKLNGFVELTLLTDSSYQGGVHRVVSLHKESEILADVNWPIRALQLKDKSMTDKNHFSPHIIETLLNIHTGVKTNYSSSSETPATEGAIKRLLSNDLITQVGAEPGRATFDLTSRGRAHVTQLLNLPLPVVKKIWANAAGEVIE